MHRNPRRCSAHRYVLMQCVSLPKAKRRNPTISICCAGTGKSSSSSSSSLKEFMSEAHGRVTVRRSRSIRRYTSSSLHPNDNEIITSESVPQVFLVSANLTHACPSAKYIFDEVLVLESLVSTIRTGYSSLSIFEVIFTLWLMLCETNDLLDPWSENSNQLDIDLTSLVILNRNVLTRSDP